MSLFSQYVWYNTSGPSITTGPLKATILKRVRNPIFSSLRTIQQSGKVGLELPDCWIDIVANAYQWHVNWYFVRPLFDGSRREMRNLSSSSVTSNWLQDSTSEWIVHWSFDLCSRRKKNPGRYFVHVCHFRSDISQYCQYLPRRSTSWRQ